MFSSKIAEHKDILTYNDYLIAETLINKYIKGQGKNALTSSEISKIAGCSQSTVIRFSQKLGYTSYKNMIRNIINEVSLNKNNKITDKESTRATIDKMKYQYNQNIEDVTILNSDESIDQAVNYLQSADMIMCFGVRGSYSIASIMYYRLLEIGRNTIISENLIEGVSYANNLNKNDVLFVVSVSGETIEVKNVVDCARKAGAKIIFITDNSNASILKDVDIVLLGSNKYLHTRSFNLIGRANSLFLTDLLFVRMWVLNEDKMVIATKDIIKKMNKYTDNSIATDSIRL